MKSRVLALCAVTAGLMMLSIPALAHHGSAAFEMSKPVSLKATVTDFQFINPHVLVYFDVKMPDGTVQKWSGELTSPNRLERSGWSRHTLKAGDQLTVVGFVAKSGAKSMWIRKFIMPDGHALNPMGGN
jgi:Family of unknown function (DUF6152)